MDRGGAEDIAIVMMSQSWASVTECPSVAGSARRQIPPGGGADRLEVARQRADWDRNYQVLEDAFVAVAQGASTLPPTDPPNQSELAVDSERATRAAEPMNAD